MDSTWQAFTSIERRVDDYFAADHPHSTSLLWDLAKDVLAFAPFGELLTQAVELLTEATSRYITALVPDAAWMNLTVIFDRDDPANDEMSFTLGSLVAPIVLGPEMRERVLNIVATVLLSAGNPDVWQRWADETRAGGGEVTIDFTRDSTLGNPPETADALRWQAHTLPSVTLSNIIRLNAWDKDSPHAKPTGEQVSAALSDMLINQTILDHDPERVARLTLILWLAIAIEVDASWPQIKTIHFGWCRHDNTPSHLRVEYTLPEGVAETTYDAEGVCAALASLYHREVDPHPVLRHHLQAHAEPVTFNVDEYLTINRWR